MALLDDVLKGWGGILIGFGAAMVAPALLPAAGSGIRPLAKTLVKGALAAADRVKEVVAEASEQVSDLVAEVRAENAAGANGSGGQKHHRSASSSHH
jgi:hypothetical protein